jgi:hypothetical protein
MSYTKPTPEPIFHVAFTNGVPSKRIQDDMIQEIREKFKNISDNIIITFDEPGNQTKITKLS